MSAYSRAGTENNDSQKGARPTGTINWFMKIFESNQQWIINTIKVLVSCSSAFL